MKSTEKIVQIIDLLDSTSRIFSPDIVGDEHWQVAQKEKKGNLIVIPEGSNSKQNIEISGGLARVLDNEILILT